LILGATLATAAPLTLTVGPWSSAAAAGPATADQTAPGGGTLTFDRRSLILDGKSWTPVMGEFHYTRCPRSEWRRELLRMKAGGVDIVSTYVFWIHHEEVEGKWDWAGDRDLGAFVAEAGAVGLKVVVRCGPWCHGEVRNGGFPDWLLSKDWNLRSTDPRFLGAVRGLYGQIAAHLKGLLWKEGGPVIAIQLDNEFTGPAEYLLALKAVARECGLDVPLYTRTGWTKVTTPMTFGEVVPLYGAYAEGFWSRELDPMPGSYWNAFRFTRLRYEAAILDEQLGKAGAQDEPDAAEYPYLTCEIGGGMMSSYHRRILLDPEDVLSTVIVKLGSGSTLPGYYMYQGGINPEGRLSTLNEAQDTRDTNYNDMPVRNYDFQAPLGAFGQERPHYNLLRRLHLFLRDYGEGLARMDTALPDVRPVGKSDTSTLRWAVRSDGTGAFVFVNNYERGVDMPARSGVQFELALPSGRVVFPAEPTTVGANRSFLWPVNLELVPGAVLEYATAEPVCKADDGDERTIFFAETPGTAAVFRLSGEAAERRPVSGHRVAFEVRGSGGRTARVVLLSDADSLALWKGRFAGRDRVFLTRASLEIEGGALRLDSPDREELSVGMFPGQPELAAGERDGVFSVQRASLPAEAPAGVRLESLRSAGPAREIPLGHASVPVASAPGDRDFQGAATWRVRFTGVDPNSQPILRIRYEGDVARLTLDGKLLVDDFYNGRDLELGLERYIPQILTGDLELQVLPLRRDAVEGPGRRIYMDRRAVPDFGGGSDVASVGPANLVPTYEWTLLAPHRLP
jgi:hypothetical protein